MLRAAAAALALFAALWVSGMAGNRSFAGSNLIYQQRGYGPPVAPVSQVAGVAAANPLIALGEKFFYDTRFSGTGSKACASCHNPGHSFAEPRWVSISDNGKLGRRNAPTLLDVGFLPRLMWDGRFQTLEQQVFGPFQSGEMGIPIEEAAHRANADPHYVSLFRAALGSFATPGGIAQAVAAWERTLVTPPSRVDRFLSHNEYGALSPLERDGYAVFTRRAGCANCHHVFPLAHGGRPSARALFSDFQYHNIGIGYRTGYSDKGRFEQSHHPGEWASFRTPSLRNSARTPPYMHDGSFGTLEEVVEFYTAGGRPNPNISPLLRPLGLSQHEKAALVAFIHAMGN
jgi:cytochrome c peroxidase